MISIQLPILKPGQAHFVDKLHGAADSHLLASYANKNLTQNKQALLVVICAQAFDAERLVAEIAYFAPKLRVQLFPDWETLPYDQLSPHCDLISARLSVLQDMRSKQCDVVVLTITAALLRMAPVAFLAAHTFYFRQKQSIDETSLKLQLHTANYSVVTSVMNPGEYSVRGGLIDIFPMGSALPYRLDLFGNEIDTIKAFDVDTQRSLYPVGEIRLLPAREFPFDDDSRTNFRKRWRERFDGDPNNANLYRDVGNGVAGAGIEYYLPLFFSEINQNNSISNLFEHLSSFTETHKALPYLALVGDINQAIERFTLETAQRYNFLSKDITKPILPPKSLFLVAEEFFTLIKSYARLIIKNKTIVKSDDGSKDNLKLPDVSIDRRAAAPLAKLQSFIKNIDNKGNLILICADSLGRQETIKQLLHAENLLPNEVNSFEQFLTSKANLNLGVAKLHAGFSFNTLDNTYWIITEAELYADASHHRHHRRQERASNIDTMVRDLSELKIGDAVVHSQHGIGRYQGLICMDLGSGTEEFLHLSYANDALLYVPVQQLNLISRYAGAQMQNAPLHQLGSAQWEKAKSKAAAQIRDTAAELLNLYAKRSIRKGHAFKISANDYEAFVAGFGFEETPDQAAAIAAVIENMSSNKPMDRLICGDVGFGKTEVALRAAFISVMDGKQVAILAPTTLLAEQHFQVFSDRFASWPVKIAEVSRFKSKKEINLSIAGIKDGSVDIIIGTHKILAPDIEFANLGLVIIDEEHRFGVRQKEMLKAMRAEIDILVMTATPIPRTLGMALEGLRDFSIIATAPQKRLAIKTFVREESSSLIREAILRELKRGGQVYFLHNEVDSIQNRYTNLLELIPQARIGIAHGQMRERELEKIMRDFVAQRFNILLCTTIIETGIDVPSANTIVMHRADKFGLAQLHQLRGRVGRSHHQAYAYLLVPDLKSLSSDANKRLDAIAAMEELGSGFYLAMHDLEIRGTGEVLGEKQSGDIIQIGFQLYTDMLNYAIKSLKDGIEPDFSGPLELTTKINLGFPARLPSDYCPDICERLSFYKNLASCKSLDEICLIKEELVDRFGKLPEPAITLLTTHDLRLKTRPLGINSISVISPIRVAGNVNSNNEVGCEQLQIQFCEKPPIDSNRIIQLVQIDKSYKLAGVNKLKISTPLSGLQARVDKINFLVNYLNNI